MKKVIFVAGPPGSGKTKFIEQYELNKYSVFDLDKYRCLIDQDEFTGNNDFVIAKAGELMNQDINNSLNNEKTIVIEATFSSIENTFEQIKNNKNYQIYIYLFITSELEAYISVLERFMEDSIKNKKNRLIKFEKFNKKYSFYEFYIDTLKKYDVDIKYVVRENKNVKILNYRPNLVKNKDDYSERINKIRDFCINFGERQLMEELEKMLNYHFI